MSFDPKKLIIATIFVSILFVLFLGYAFNSIQKVELDIQIHKDQEIDPKLEDIANEIIANKDVAFCDDVSLKDIGTDILLINHENKSACIISELSVFAVNYEKLDKNIIYCNNFIVIIEGAKTVIINTDDLLGNAVARAITIVYHYEYAKTNGLSPENVVHFQTVDQDEQTDFLRYAMIESAKSAYLNDGSLDEFYYYYDQWTDYKGRNQYQEVINYDYYDGLKVYITAKVLAVIDKDFSLEAYMDSFKNQYGIYSKDDEFAMMGLLWSLIVEKQGRSVLSSDELRGDQYKVMLEGVPLGSVEDKNLYADYAEKFAQYQENIQRIIERCKDDVTTITPTPYIMTTETYEGTIKVADNRYIYVNYKGIDSDYKQIKQEYLTVEIQPYSLKYYVK